MELVPLVTDLAKTLGPTGALATVIFSMWFKNRNGKSEKAPSSSIADHDALIRIETNVDTIMSTVAVVETDVKALIKDSHVHPIP